MVFEKKVNSFFILAFLFLVFGLLLIGDVSLLEAERSFGDQFYFLKRQLSWAGLGLILFLIGAKVNFRFWRRISFPLFIFSLIPLGLVLLPQFGQVIGGSRRWLAIGPFHFQPSESVKFSLFIYLASLFSQRKINFWQFLLILIAPISLTVLEPDFGTAVIMAGVALVLWFLSGVSFKKIVFPSILFLVLGILLIYLSPYRRERVLGMIDPFFDPQGKSYHSYQLVLTLGSGGLWGVGMGQSRQKYQYLPHVTTDSIMAIAGEEFGLIGLSLILVSFLVMLWSGYKIVSAAADNFGQLLGMGFLTWIAFQGLINISAIAVVVPLTGVPFPLVSYGGSSLVLTLFSLGIIYNIWQCPQK